MLARQTVPAAVIAAALVSVPAPSSAQAPDSLTAIQCPRQPFETDNEWGNRCYAEEERRIKGDTDRRVRDAQRATAETTRQRAILEKQPALPASRNPLLGRWETAARPSGGGDPFAQIGTMLNGCIIFGDGFVEFEPTRWAVYDNDGRNDMGAIEYRAGANGAVFGLPAKGSIFALLPFEFETPDWIRLSGVVCTLKRTNATVPAGRATPARGGAVTPAAPAAASRGATAPSTPTRSPLDRFNSKRGYDCPAPAADVAADSCTGETPNDTCVVVRIDLPLKNGAPVTFTETIAAFTQRVASCKQRPLMFLNGELFFAP